MAIFAMRLSDPERRLQESPRLLLLAYLILTFVHLLFIPFRDAPAVFADELGYLGAARYLSGTGLMPNMQGTSFYHAGYSILLAPLFWVAPSPLALYRATLVFNCFLSSTVLFAVYYVLREFTRQPRHRLVWISLCTCLYPPAILNSTVAWSENLVLPVFGITIVLMDRLLKTPSIMNAGLLGFVAGFFYFVHPRGLPVALLVSVVLLLFWLKGMLRWHGLAMGLGAGGIVLGIAQLIHRHLLAVGWGYTGGIGGRDSLLQYFFDEQPWILGFQIAAGQLLYLGQATYGLFWLGSLVVVQFILNHRHKARSGGLLNRECSFWVSVFLVLSSLAIFLPSVAIVVWATGADGVVRADRLVYGRYNDPFILFFLAFGLSAVMALPRRQRWATLAAPVLAMAACSAFLGILPPSELVADTLAGNNVFGTVALFDAVGRFDLPLVSMLTILAFLLMFPVARLGRWAAPILTAALFLWGCFGGVAHVMKTHAESIVEAGAFSELVSSLSRQTGISGLSWDKAIETGEGLRSMGFDYFASQFLLPGLSFTIFDGRLGEKPESRLVISHPDFQLTEDLGGEFVSFVGQNRAALWYFPSPADLAKPVWEIPPAGANLGSRRHPLVWEQGFHGNEEANGIPVRWTDGDAELRVPIDGNEPPGAIEIGITCVLPRARFFRLTVNDRVLYSGEISGEWNRVFSFSRTSPPMGNIVKIRLQSDTFMPSRALANSPDTRTLGVRVEGIRLISGGAVPAETP